MSGVLRAQRPSWRMTVCGAVALREEGMLAFASWGVVAL